MPLLRITKNESASFRQGKDFKLFGGVQLRLALSFGAAFTLALAALAAVTFFGIPPLNFSGLYGLHIESAEKWMNFTTDLKVERLKYWIEESRRDLGLVVMNQDRVASIEGLCARFAAEIGREDRDKLLEAVHKDQDFTSLQRRLSELVNIHNEYSRLFIIEAASKVVIGSSDVSMIGKSYARNPDVEKALLSSGGYTSDVKASKNGAVLYLCGTFRRHSDEKAVGVLVAEINTDAVLRPLLDVGEALGESGETVLVNGDARILMSLKHPLADGSRPKPLEYTITAEAAQRAIRGDNGIIWAKDYRGVPVLASYRYVQVTPDLAWGMGVKCDQDEIFLPLRHDAKIFAVVGTLGAILIFGVAFWVAKTVTKPIKLIAEAARQVGEGDLTVRAPIVGDDELAVCAATFNAMVARVESGRDQLEELVLQRTKELRSANAELQKHRSQLEALVEERTKKLEEAQNQLIRQEKLAALGQLTAAVSHELRNPLGTIRTSCYTLNQKYGSGDGEASTIIRRIDRGITRCDGIITDLLDYSRIKAAERVPTDVDDLLELWATETPKPENVTVKTDLRLGEPVPLDRERFYRCFSNLFNNAIQSFGESGGTILVSSRRDGEHAVVEISDDGCGVPSDKIETVFEPLYSTKTFGVGLGLPIARQIVQQHDGELSMKSQLGKGTTVTVRIPLRTSNQEGHESSESTIPTSTATT